MAVLFPSPDTILLLAAYMILMGSILAFAIYEFNSGVAFQVATLLLVGFLFAVLVHFHVITTSGYFVSFVIDFTTPLITHLVLVLVFVGMGLKLGWEARSFSGEGVRILAASTAMAFVDILPGALIFGYICEAVFGWPWIYGALLGTLMGETSAAVVIPYVDHMSTLSHEKGTSSMHTMRLSNVLKLESTLNSITLLLFMVLFYNEIYSGNVNPTTSSFLSTTWSSLVLVFVQHWPALMVVIFGIPVLIYVSSKLIVMVTERKLVDRATRKLKVTAVFSMNDMMLVDKDVSKEFGEKQFRIGMMLYGIILGIALLIYETIQTQPATSFAGIGTPLFSLVALLYLGFFLGYLFPGNRTRGLDSETQQTGKQAFTGMMLFHEEFELLSRIIFYFSVGVSLGFMVLSPPSGAQVITGHDWIGILIMAIIMGPAFILLRFLSGIVGLPITFYSRFRRETYRQDFKLLAATMPKGITVAAVAVLILQSGIAYSTDIYVLALLSVVISTIGFTVISTLKSRQSKGDIDEVDTPGSADSADPAEN